MLSQQPQEFIHWN